MSEPTLPYSSTYVAQIFDDNLWEQSERAIARLDWSAGASATRQREFAALVFRAAFAAGRISDTPPIFDDVVGCVVIDADAPGTTPDNDHAIESLYNAIGAWIPNGAPAPSEFVIASYGVQNDAGYGAAVLIGLGVLAVIGMSIQALTVGYAIEKTAEITDNQLARISQSGQLAQHIGAVTKIVERHADDEKAAGHALPMSEPAKAAIDSLNQTARIVAERRPPAVTTPIGNSVEKVGTAAAGAVSWVPWVAVAALGGFLLVRSK